MDALVLFEPLNSGGLIDYVTSTLISSPSREGLSVTFATVSAKSLVGFISVKRNSSLFRSSSFSLTLSHSGLCALSKFARCVETRAPPREDVEGG